MASIQYHFLEGIEMVKNVNNKERRTTSQFVNGNGF